MNSRTTSLICDVSLIGSSTNMRSNGAFPGRNTITSASPNHLLGCMVMPTGRGS